MAEKPVFGARTEVKAAWLFCGLMIEVGSSVAFFNIHLFFCTGTFSHTAWHCWGSAGAEEGARAPSHGCSIGFGLRLQPPPWPSLLLPRAQAYTGSSNGQTAETDSGQGYPAACTDWDEMGQLRGAPGAVTGQEVQEAAATAVPMLAKDVLAQSLNPTHTRRRTSLKTFGT